MSEILKQVVGETFMTTVDDFPREITRLEMLIKALVSHAERGDKTCLNLLLKELRHIDDRDAIVNSPAEQELQKMKEASESLVRKMHEFRNEYDPDYREQNKADNTQHGGANPPAEAARADDALHEPPHEGDIDDPPNDYVIRGDAAARAAVAQDSRPAEEPRQSPQEASESLLRKMDEFRMEHDPEYRRRKEAENSQPKSVGATQRKRE